MHRNRRQGKEAGSCRTPRPRNPVCNVRKRKIEWFLGCGPATHATEHMSDNIAIYPGSFDPITNGHLDLIERGRHLFDHLVVALLTNLEKQPLFSVDERLEMLRLVTKGMPNVSLDTFSGLLVDYAMRRKARALLRGIRAFSDYEYELQMALMNRKLEP